MIKVEVIENFTLKRFDELKNIERANQDIQGKLNIGDKFECEKELADYLLGNNPLKKPVVKIIEVKPIKVAIKNEIKIDSKKIKEEVVKKTIKKKSTK